jgi:hypothetical protein
VDRVADTAGQTFEPDQKLVDGSSVGAAAAGAKPAQASSSWQAWSGAFSSGTPRTDGDGDRRMRPDVIVRLPGGNMSSSTPGAARCTEVA